MKYFKYILVLLLLAVALPAVNAATSTYTISAATQTNALQFASPIKLTSISIANNDGSSRVFRLFDAPNTSAIYTNATYDVQTNYVATVVTTYSNFSGVTENRTNTSLISTNLTIAENTSANYRTIDTITAGASATTTKTYTGGKFFNLGMLVTNAATTSAVITFTYQN